MLYFGDSLRSDVAPSKKCDWETVLILEEIELEQCLFYSGAEQPNEKNMKVVSDQSVNLHSSNVKRLHAFLKAKMYAISSDTHQLQSLKLHHFKLERF